MVGLNNGASGLSEGIGLYLKQGLYTGPGLITTLTSYDPASIALFDAFTGHYSNAVYNAINAAIVDLKTSGAWDDFDVLYPKGAIPGTSAANIADGYLNWKSPGTFTLIAVNSPINGNGYWQGDGASARLRTQYTPSVSAVKYLQNDASVGAWAKLATTAGIVDLGNFNVAPQFYLYIRNATTTSATVVNGGTVIPRGSTNGLGLTIAQRRASNDLRLWNNGSQLGTTETTVASTGRPTAEQWILGGNSTQFSSVKQIQLAWWGASQTGREATLYSIFQTLFTAAGTI